MFSSTFAPLSLPVEAAESNLISSVELTLDRLLRPTLVSSLPPLTRLREPTSSLPVTHGNTGSLLSVTNAAVCLLCNIAGLESAPEADGEVLSDVALTEPTEDITENDVISDGVEVIRGGTDDAISDVADDAVSCGGNDIISDGTDDDAGNGITGDNMEADDLTPENAGCVFSAGDVEIAIALKLFAVF